MRLVVPVLAVAALAAGAVVVPLLPAVAAVSPTTVAATAPTTASQPMGVARGHGALQKTGKCLKRYDVPGSDLTTVFSQDAPPTSDPTISAQTIRSAGTACQTTMDKITAAAGPDRPRQDVTLADEELGSSRLTKVERVRAIVTLSATAHRSSRLTSTRVLAGRSGTGSSWHGPSSVRQKYSNRKPPTGIARAIPTMNTWDPNGHIGVLPHFAGSSRRPRNHAAVRATLDLWVGSV